MRDFTKKVIDQVENIYDFNFSKNYKELIMALFMQFFSYNFDDRIDATIKFKDIQDISNACWGTLVNKTNEDVGIPFFSSKEEYDKFQSYSINGKTEYILNEIRGSIVHGAFNINDDGTITITDQFFKMTFEFECIVDICTTIANQLNIEHKNAKQLFDFLLFFRDKDNKTDEYNKARIEYSFWNMKYPILLFNLLPMNEDDFHNDPEYGEFICNLFSEKYFYKKGRLKGDNILKINELYKLRNCIAHGQYYFDKDDLILEDNKEVFVFRCLKLDELFKQNLKPGSK